MLVFRVVSEPTRVEHTKGELLLGEELVFPELLDLAGKDLLRGRRAVDTAGLDGDQETTTSLEEELRVNSDNTVKG